MSRFPDYLVIGHVTKDLMPDASYRLGGTASYSAVAARRLGLHVGVLTSAEPGVVPFAAADEIQTRSVASETTTVFENIIVGGHRLQYLRALAGRIDVGALPDEWRHPRIVHLGPVAQEVDLAYAAAFPDAFVGVTPQGWLRRWDAGGAVSVAQWPMAQDVLGKVDAVVLSPEDVGGDMRQVERFARWARVLVLTLGARGAIVYQCDRAVRVPAFSANEIDPTGAGDVFAAAFFIEYSSSGDTVAAARFANAAASFVVEGMGTSTIPSRASVLERLARAHMRE